MFGPLNYYYFFFLNEESRLLEHFFPGTRSVLFAKRTAERKTACTLKRAKANPAALCLK